MSGGTFLGSRTIPYHRRSLQDEIELEYEERESFDKFEPEKEETTGKIVTKR